MRKSEEGIYRAQQFAYALTIVQVDYTLPTHPRRFAREVRARKDTEITIPEDR